MTWQEHENEYCKSVESVDELSVYSIHDSWAGAMNCIDNYEMGYEDGNCGSLGCVKFQTKYYVYYKT